MLPPKAMSPGLAEPELEIGNAGAVGIAEVQLAAPVDTETVAAVPVPIADEHLVTGDSVEERQRRVPHRHRPIGRELIGQIGEPVRCSVHARRGQTVTIPISEQRRIARHSVPERPIRLSIDPHVPQPVRLHEYHLGRGDRFRIRIRNQYVNSRQFAR